MYVVLGCGVIRQWFDCCCGATELMCMPLKLFSNVRLCGQRMCRWNVEKGEKYQDCQVIKEKWICDRREV